MICYKLDTVWLCRITKIVRSNMDGIMVHFEYEPTYVLVWDEEKILVRKKMEIPVYRNVISGEEYYDGTTKGVFNICDIGKTFVTERRRIPEDYFTDEELESGVITEERFLALYRTLFYSKLL